MTAPGRPSLPSIVEDLRGRLRRIERRLANPTPWAAGDGGALHAYAEDGGLTTMGAGPIVGAWFGWTVPETWGTFRLDLFTSGQVNDSGTTRALFAHEYRLDGGGAVELSVSQGQYEAAGRGQHVVGWGNGSGLLARPASGLVEVRYLVTNVERTNDSSISADNLTTTARAWRAS